VNAMANILAPGSEGNVVVLQGWPAQLTLDQLRAYTNWSASHIEDLTRQGKIKSLRSGRAGARVWFRASVDKHLEDEFDGNGDDDF